MAYTKSEVLAKAKREGILAQFIQKGTKGYYIVPNNLTEYNVQKVYVNCMDQNNDSNVCLNLAEDLQKKQNTEKPVG